MLSPKDFKPYQTYAVNCMLNMPECFLAIDMGMGKTVVTLTAMKKLLFTHKIQKVLVIAPLEVAKDTWPKEIAKWSHLKGKVTHTLLRVEDSDPYLKKFEASSRTEIKYEMLRKKLMEPTHFHFINKESVQWLVEEFRGKNFPYDVIVVDESSMLKSWSLTVKQKPTKREIHGEAEDVIVKKRFTRFGAIASVRKFASRVILLTGTPSPNGLQDLGGQMFILDGGERLGRYKTHFLERYFDSNRYSRRITPKPWAHEAIMEKLKDVMVSLRSEDYLDLPELIYNTIEVEMPKSVMVKYRKFEETLVSEFLDVEAVNQADLVNKLLQFSNGSVYRADPDNPDAVRKALKVHDCKLVALDRVIEEANGKPVLIAYSYKFDCEAIKKRYREAVSYHDDPNFVDNWNAGKIKIGVAHPASIGHGLNLQYGGNIAVHYGLNWSLELYQQFNKRLHRVGQKQAVILHHIICKDTMDERVMQVLQGKSANQEDVMNSVRKRMEDIKREMRRGRA